MRQSIAARAAVLLAGALCALANPTAAAWPQTAVDPQSLIGEWSGSWIERRGAKLNGRYYLWIEKVEGDTVHGRGEVIGQRTFEYKFKGTLTGNRLTFGRDPVVERLIEGDRMKGGTQGAVSRDITLTKVK